MLDFLGAWSAIQLEHVELGILRPQRLAEFPRSRTHSGPS